MEKARLRAYCNSNTCVGCCNIKHVEIKEVSKYDIDCPRCKSALFWARDNKRELFVKKKEKGSKYA